MLYQSEEYVEANSEGEETRLRKVHFTFDPREFEAVRIKDGSYLLRRKKPKVEAVP